MKDKSITILLCDLIEASIYYGGDRGGPYYEERFENGFIDSINNFIANTDIDIKDVLDELSKRSLSIFNGKSVDEVIQMYKNNLGIVKTPVTKSQKEITLDMLNDRINQTLVENDLILGKTAKSIKQEIVKITPDYIKVKVTVQPLFAVEDIILNFEIE